MIRIWLDDERPEPEGWMRVHNFAEAMQALGRYHGQINVLSCDNDLGEDLTGYDLVKWIAECANTDPNYWPDEIRVHSANPVGLRNMRAVIDRYGDYSRCIEGWVWVK